MKTKITPFILLLSLQTLLCLAQPEKVSVKIVDGIWDDPLKQRIEQNSSILFAKLNEAYIKGSENPTVDSNIITTEGLEKINDLWKDSKFYCPSDKISEIIVQKGDVYQLRNVPIFYGINDRFDIVVEYNNEGRINDFYIALEAHQYKTLLDATTVVDRTRREIIVNFLENLRTAYVKKDLDYIEKLYSDKALIIIGKVLKTENVSTDQFQPSLTKNQIDYQVLTKSEYITKLKSVFNSINYLKLDFKDIEVVKHRKHPNFYGIKLQQIWETPRYKDDGLLFLLVQFKENEDPIIWVRTWQDAQKTSIDEAFGLHNFKISTGNIQN
jgi:hypothetical protein